MKQTKRLNSHLESPECYDAPQSSFKISRTISQQETVKISSTDFTLPFEEIIKKYKSVKTSPNKFYDTDNKTWKELRDVSTRYAVQFSVISCQFEKWSAQRRLLIRKLESLTRSINQLKSYCSKGRLIFSSVDVAGTLGSSILCSLNVDWSSKLLFASATFGCLSLVCNLIEISCTKSLVEEALKELREDNSLLRTLQILFQKMRDFQKSIHNLFPHGVDDKIVRELLRSEEDPIDVPSNMEELVKTPCIPSKRIFLAVLMSNAKEELTLLEDEDFLEKVDKFSKSRIAEVWWRRMECEDFPVSSKSELEAELSSCLKMDSVPYHIAPLVSAPIWYGNILHTVGSVFLNGLVVYDALWELSGSQQAVEVDALKQLKHALQQEHIDIMNFYEKFNPYYD